MPNTTLIYNMANALKICHLRYENMKRMSNAQKEEIEIIHLGVISVIEMHCNDTGTRNDKTVKETFALITERHLKALKEDATSIRMRLEEAKLQENKKTDANQTNESSEEEEESNDEEQMVYKKSNNRKINVFDDDDEDDDHDKNNTATKETTSDVISGTSTTETTAEVIAETNPIQSEDDKTADATTTTDTTAEEIAENATNPLHGEDNTIGHEKEAASKKMEGKGKRLETKKKENQNKR
jgi:hypothetical protein